ncbi:MAG TPA: hypothetical protein VMA35_03540 [Candidatus Sulfopaludibacter sp.]|nr:hypothetical protein [Candidatus Sulfopaludibacter sp.]
MKNRLKLYFGSEPKPHPRPPRAAHRNLQQFKLITLYGALSREKEDADASVKGHYEQVLLSLKRLIESLGPSADYEQWVNSLSVRCPVPSGRRSR